MGPVDERLHELVVLRAAGRPRMHQDRSPQTTFTNPKLWPDTTYNYSIIAVDANGNRSAPSNTVTYTTPPDTTAPSPPPALTTTSVYPARISVSWTASTDNTSQVSY